MSSISTMTHRFLALATASGRVGEAFFIGDELVHWSLSFKAGRGPADAADCAAKWFEDFRPTALVIEDFGSGFRKGPAARRTAEAVIATAGKSGILIVPVARTREHPNKYREAEALVARYPDLAPWQPRREKIYDNEPATTVIFDAVALAQPVLADPMGTLTRAMG